MSEQQAKFEEWAIVELFGHQRVAGLVSETQIGGQSFVRVDVPECPAIPAVPGRDWDHPEGYQQSQQEHPALPGWTKLYGGGAIYAISFVDEDAARAVAHNIRVKPVDVFALRDWLKKLQSDNQAKLPYARMDTEAD